MRHASHWFDYAGTFALVFISAMGDRTQKLVLNQLKLMLHVLFHVVAPNRNVLC